MWRRLRVIVRQPATIFVLIVLLAGDIFCLRSRHLEVQTVASELFRSTLRWHRSTREVVYEPQWWWGAAYGQIFERADGTLMLSLPYRDPNETPVPTRVGWLSVRILNAPFGLYAPTHKGQFITCTVHFDTPGRGELDPIVRRELVSRMNRHSLLFDPPLTASQAEALIERGWVSRGRHLPLGYLHNILALSMLVLLGWSLWVQASELPGRLRLWLFIERWRYDPDRCPRCGYSLLGLVQGKCPECGEEFPPLPSVHSHPDDSGLTQSRSS